MKRVLSILAVALFTCVMALPSGVAHADQGEEITRFEVVADVDRDGTFHVTQTIDYNFTYPGHGIYAYFTTRQEFTGTLDRLINYTDFSVTSPTGAPSSFTRESDRETTYIRIGDPDVSVIGLQTYVISYTVTGIVNPEVEESGMDEIFWNAVPPGWEVPISNVTVTINGPVDVVKTACLTGRFNTNWTDPCISHSSEGSSATWTHDRVSPGSGVAVTAGFPAKTFTGVNIETVSKSQSPFDLTTTGGKVAAGSSGIVAAIAGWILTHFTKRGRDAQYANVAPGMLPVAGDKVEIKYAEVTDAPVAFAPPPGVPPGLVSALIREGTKDEDITATIIDLAVRGHLHFEQGKGKDFTISPANSGRDPLTPVEQSILKGLIGSGRPITSTEMTSAKFYSTYQGFKAMIDKDFHHQKWYKSNPQAVVAAWRTGGLFIAAAGSAGAIYLGSQLGKSGLGGLGWLAIPFAIFGLGMAAIAGKMPVRTPVGSAVAYQGFGFKKYLETAEAKQIKWEEGQDIFSQYLPYAIGFGCADRWAKIFEQLVAMGAPVPQPTWYTGYPGARGPVWGSINRSMDRMGSTFGESVRANAMAQAQATGGSIGGSGFSGGSFGGGVGGGGGGRW
ncbi:MAG: DUF2207 domain-containing protein [Propionibacteriaceae bacterium]|nr:DUF2207 domain-containing protein [Propionibacteriaceae bacterium]